jgi:hypothetical protein
MSGTPFAFVPEIEIAEGAGKRKMAVIGAATPSWRAFLELVERAVDLGLLALLPGRVPLLFGAESLLIDQQQRGIEDAGRPMSQGPRFPAFGSAPREQHRCGLQTIEILADSRLEPPYRLVCFLPLYLTAADAKRQQRGRLRVGSKNASLRCPLYPHVWTAPSWQGLS